jgi:uncharacterized protein DUF222/HNH endonuclease
MCSSARGDVDPSRLGDDALIAWVDDLERERRANDADRARALAELERRRSHLADGHLSTAAWLADRHGLSQADSATRVRVARAVEHMPLVAAALSRGEISSAAVDALTRVRDDAPEAFSRAESRLLERARHLPHRDLRTELDEWRRRVDAEAAERDEAERLARRRFGAILEPEGMVRADGELDPENGQYLITALRAKVDAWARSLIDDARTPAQRRADALGEICREWLDLAERPTIGGERPHVVVTIDLETLERRARRTSMLDDAGPITAETARRLACDAGVTRVIVDPQSQPLDVGRKTKVVPPSMRRAVTVRDRGCAFPGCERPPAWTDAHHVRHWADGGETALSNLVLLCRPHHRLIHANRFSVAIVDDRPVFRRPDGSALEHRGPPVAA